MRKIVCSYCAQDWQIQHVCPDGHWRSVAVPTVIYEPQPMPRTAADALLLENRALSAALRDAEQKNEILTEKLKQAVEYLARAIDPDRNTKKGTLEEIENLIKERK